MHMLISPSLSFINLVAIGFSGGDWEIASGSRETARNMTKGSSRGTCGRVGLHQAR